MSPFTPVALLLHLDKPLVETDASLFFPEGHEKHLGEDHNTLLLVAGGSGVSYTLSNSLNLVRRTRAMHLALWGEEPGGRDQKAVLLVDGEEAGARGVDW